LDFASPLLLIFCEGQEKFDVKKSMQAIATV